MKDVIFNKKAKKQYEYWKHNNKKIYDKINNLIINIQ